MTNELQDGLVAQLRQGLVDRNWTQDQLADRAGVAQSAISSMLSGRRTGSLGTWNKLLRALEVR